MQCETGGFAGGPGQEAHLAPTYAAVNVLAIIGTKEAYDVINRTTLLEFLLRVKQKDGSFTMAVGGEIDVRGSYCAMSAATITNIMTPELTSGAAEFIGRCERYQRRVWVKIWCCVLLTYVPVKCHNIDVKRMKAVLVDTQEWRPMEDMHSVDWQLWSCWEEQMFSMLIPLWYVVEPIAGYIFVVISNLTYSHIFYCMIEMEREQANVTRRRIPRTDQQACGRMLLVLDGWCIPHRWQDA